MVYTNKMPSLFCLAVSWPGYPLSCASKDMFGWIFYKLDNFSFIILNIYKINKI